MHKWGSNEVCCSARSTNENRHRIIGLVKETYYINDTYAGKAEKCTHSVTDGIEL